MSFSRLSRAQEHFSYDFETSTAIQPTRVKAVQCSAIILLGTNSYQYIVLFTSVVHFLTPYIEKIWSNTVLIHLSLSNSPNIHDIVPVY